MPTTPALPARFADPPAPPTPSLIVSRWEQFLGVIATGTAIPDAMLACFIKKREIQAMCNQPAERKRYQEAKLAGLRSAYSEFDLDEFFNRVAMGATIKAAFMEVFGVEVQPVFYEILRSDADMEARYQSALKTKATLEMEKSMEIIDDDSNDVLEGPKGPVPNNAAVNRSKLRFEGRARLASSWYRRIFGEKEQTTQVNVQVNHAVILEEARARARDQRMTPRGVKEFTDAVYEAVPVKEEPLSTDWMEDK